MMQEFISFIKNLPIAPNREKTLLQCGIEPVIRTKDDQSWQILFDLAPLSKIQNNDKTDVDTYWVEQKIHQHIQSNPTLINPINHKTPPQIIWIGKAAASITPASNPAQTEKTMLPNIKYIIGIGSGKGGVGKSSISMMLAYFMSKRLRVGLLDADIYGPSIPSMIGQNKARATTSKNGLIQPSIYNQLRYLSISHFMPEQSNKDKDAIMWRGSMASRALSQMLTTADWGNLDILFIDLPPGTGDLHLSLFQKYYITGCFVVSTPQKIAMIDAMKFASMLDRLGVKNLGFIQNMAHIECSECGHHNPIFPNFMDKSAELDAFTLAKIPFQQNLCEILDFGLANCDDGTVDKIKGLEKICDMLHSFCGQ